MIGKFFNPNWQQDVLDKARALPPAKELIAIFFGCVIFTIIWLLLFAIIFQMVSTHTIFYRLWYGKFTDSAILSLDFQGWQTAIYLIKYSAYLFIFTLLLSTHFCPFGLRIKTLIFQKKARKNNGRDFTIAALIYFNAILLVTMGMQRLLVSQDSLINLILPFTLFFGGGAFLSMLLALGAYEFILNPNQTKTHKIT